jgi:glycosyltransferase involved in cell wall biosynthesis
LPLLEARLLRRPVIAADTEFAQEILKDYEFAKFFNYNDSFELAEHITQIVNTTKKITNSNPEAYEKYMNESLADALIREVST